MKVFEHAQTGFPCPTKAWGSPPPVDCDRTPSANRTKRVTKGGITQAKPRTRRALEALDALCPRIHSGEDQNAPCGPPGGIADLLLELPDAPDLCSNRLVI